MTAASLGAGEPDAGVSALEAMCGDLPPTGFDAAGVAGAGTWTLPSPESGLSAAGGAFDVPDSGPAFVPDASTVRSPGPWLNWAAMPWPVRQSRACRSWIALGFTPQAAAMNRTRTAPTTRVMFRVTERSPGHRTDRQ
jgi:hypothetical protein